MSGFGPGDPLRVKPSSGVTPFVLIAVVVAVAATLAGAALLVVRRGGEAAADANESALTVADRAADAEAQSWLRNALTAARVLSAEGGADDAVTPERLAAIDQGVTFTSGPADAPRVVSVAGTASGFGAAARSGSGTCFWIHDEASGTFYGTGEPCTGAAALGAVQPTW